jgi:virulence-associated protein VagC
MNDSLRTITILDIAEGQVVVLPREFHFQSDRVTVRRAGEAVILEPVKATQWPAGFFESIRIDDPQFTRPDQGVLPPIPAL